MSVRKRAWTTSKGERKEAWIVDYADQDGDRHIETFDLKKDADDYHETVRVDVRQGSTRRRARASPSQRPRKNGSIASSWRAGADDDPSSTGSTSTSISCRA